jgi:VWFA-related protein
VHDRQGHAIGGLHAIDFEVLDNNQPREITFFSEQRFQPAGRTASSIAARPPETAARQAPRSIALFFDDAHASMLGVRKSAEAAAKLITNTLSPGDLVAIFTSSGSVSVDFTNDRKVLLAALARLTAHPLSGVNAKTICPTLGPSEAYIITGIWTLRSKTPPWTKRSVAIVATSPRRAGSRSEAWCRARRKTCGSNTSINPQARWTRSSS